MNPFGWGVAVVVGDAVDREFEGSPFVIQPVDKQASYTVYGEVELEVIGGCKLPTSIIGSSVLDDERITVDKECKCSEAEVVDRTSAGEGCGFSKRGADIEDIVLQSETV